ncbi:cobalt/nickel transport system permease protein [Sporomusaceae bacterium BoRhaA]|uniref:cobalt transporter CbiM n=1 Tax=Pelorhabdus rhamnosifermentans TaxID=2772457 RepID=UPI001C062F25|nr:cobalt transporter CbiM [Pelorhabdus rhamnosifermentans]MBU2701579.1 cobalt/nickel transport system permease protein [Pelorhabdus rhamnosifermentans]
MHIPDGYLSPSTCLTLGAVMLPIWYRASAKLKRTLDVTRIPLISMGAVFAFLIMMFNVPIPDGTTAHATGAILLAIVLGPWAAVIAMSVALVIQALVFGDGGILAIGANTFNMAFIAPFIGYAVYRLLSTQAVNGSRRQFFASAIAGYCGLNVAAMAAAIEFGLQPLLFKAADGTPLYCPYGFDVTIPAMMIAHLTVAGVVEGLVTAVALKFIISQSADLIMTSTETAKEGER